tara:strand:- start:190 stop:432 length:243 start_codon:yes stop_codon:yes gene_type:complete
MMKQEHDSLWADTLKKEVIEYTVDRDRHKEMLSLFEKVAIVLNDIKYRVDRNSLRDYSDDEIELMEDTLKKVEKLVGEKR